MLDYLDIFPREGWKGGASPRGFQGKMGVLFMLPSEGDTLFLAQVESLWISLGLRVGLLVFLLFRPSRERTQDQDVSEDKTSLWHLSELWLLGTRLSSALPLSSASGFWMP